MTEKIKAVLPIVDVITKYIVLGWMGYKVKKVAQSLREIKTNHLPHMQEAITALADKVSLIESWFIRHLDK